jgi:hypothetical protein
VFIAWLVLSVGLLLYIRIARTSFLVFIVAFGIANFFWGFKVFAPYEVAVGNFIGLFQGAILALAYLTSVSDKFNEG